MSTIDKIFNLLKKNNMTAKDLAKSVGLSGGNITDWKTGRANPSISSLKKIANFFNVSLEWLLENDDTINSQQQIEHSAYFRVMQSAKEKGYTPEDLKLAMDFLDRARKRDNINED